LVLAYSLGHLIYLEVMENSTNFLFLLFFEGTTYLPDGDSHEKDFVLLTDIFPTGWGGVSLSGFKPGETIAVFGAGPVGLINLHSDI
jgi:hypothetical protein